MKVVAVIDADLETTPLGTKSRLTSELHGVSVLRRTVDNVLRSERLNGVFVVCPPDQVPRCREVLEGAPVTFSANQAGDPPFRRLMRTARKWSLDGWRGGAGLQTKRIAGSGKSPTREGSRRTRPEDRRTRGCVRRGHCGLR